VFNPADTPELTVWNNLENGLNTVRDLLNASNGPNAAAFLVAARLQHLFASGVRQMEGWVRCAEKRTYMAIVAISGHRHPCRRGHLAAGLAAAGAASDTAVA
jgi:hypothetical protein